MSYDRLSLGIGLAGEVHAAEAEAHREMDAAALLDGVARTPPLWDQEAEDAWWITVFSVTEREMEELAGDAARRYKAIPSWKRAARREARSGYIRAQARLTAAHGLETRWY